MVEVDHYSDFWKITLDDLGYSSVFMPKFNEGDHLACLLHGSVLAVRKASLELASSEQHRFTDLLRLQCPGDTRGTQVAIIGAVHDQTSGQRLTDNNCLGCRIGAPGSLRHEWAPGTGTPSIFLLARWDDHPPAPPKR